MTNEQYEKLVELVDSIEFIDKELIDTNKFVAKFHKIFSKDYEAPTIYPWTNKPGVRDIGTSSAPDYDPIKIMYYGTGNGNPKIMYDGPAKDDNKIMYDGNHEITISNNEIHTSSDDNIYSIPKTPLEILRRMETQWGEAPREVCCEDQEATLRSVYSDPRNVVTVDE